MSQTKAQLISGTSAQDVTFGQLTASTVAGGVLASTSEVNGTTTTGTITSGTTSLTVASASGITSGMYVVGEGITPGTTVSSIVSTTVTLSANANATLSSDPVTFYSASKIVTPAVIGGQLCKAWVNFNGTSTVAIRASYNVSSITDNGTGDYTVNLTTALADANYSINGTAARTGTTAQAGAGFTLTANDVVAARTSSACRLIVLVNAGDAAYDTPIDSAHVNVAIFR